MIEIPSVRIWDEAPHSAFTDLVRFRGRFFCCFREGAGHVPGAERDVGQVRVIASADGKHWESVAQVHEPGVDLRDPKLSVTPDGRLLLVMGGAVHDGGTLVSRAPWVAFSDAQGAAFGPAFRARLDPAVARGNDWLWRVTWHGGRAWGVVYQPSRNEPWGLVLVESGDGVEWRHAATLELEGSPNEATVRFVPGGAAGDTAVVLVRREGGERAGAVGWATPPYREWTWRSLGRRLGGPDFVRLPDDTLVCATRSHDGSGGTTTILARFDLAGSFTPLVLLPSAGDTSYPGLVLDGDELWISYYSSHEEKTAIYLARVPLAALC